MKLCEKNGQIEMKFSLVQQIFFQNIWNLLKKIIVTSILSMLMCSASFASTADVSASAITGVSFEKGQEGGTASLDQVRVNLTSEIN